MNWKDLDKRSRLAVLLLIPICCLIFVWSYEPAKEALMQRLPFFAEQSEYMNEDDWNIYDLSPIDEEGAKRVAQEPSVRENDTWTICYYMIGSDLEDQEENNLSEITKFRQDSCGDSDRRSNKME